MTRSTSGGHRAAMLPGRLTRDAARSLQHDLVSAIGAGVRFDGGSRALYSTDASNYRQVPIGVVVPRTIDDVVRTVEVCRIHRVPILPRGGGTSLAGQTCNVAVVIDFSKHLNRVLEIDPTKKVARVQPGVILDTLRDAAEQHQLTFGPDPATHNRNTLGGMIGNNSCGVHSVMAGKTGDNVLELEVLTYDGLRLRVGPTDDARLDALVNEGGRSGEIYRKLRDLRDRHADEIHHGFPDIPRRISGFPLDQLLPENDFNVARALTGTEGTCVTVLEATLRLVDSPPRRALVVLGFPDIYTACDRVPVLMEHDPIGLEGMDGFLVEDMRKKHLHPSGVARLPAGDGWLIIEFGGDTADEAEDRARGLVDAVRQWTPRPSARLVTDSREQHQVWAVREAALAASAEAPGRPPAWPGWEDSAAPPDRLGDYLRDLRKLMDRYGYHGDLYGHFGQGCVHGRMNFDLRTADGIAHFRAFMGDAADLVVRYGGSLSGEHGDGQARAELLPKMYPSGLMQAFREFKQIWDPDWMMNPGKVVDPNPIVSDLRLGTSYEPAPVKTHFKYPSDGGSFARAALRCVGVGQCRRLGGGTMCPSFMVTREEADTTRGRARLLFEMLEGDVIAGWRDDHVRDALDLCLACKGCKGDCPVEVDMATYKAEFLSHYYEHRLRPRSAYAMGLIHWWARLASVAPSLANVMTQVPLLSGVAHAAGGIAPQRSLPAFAPQTFRQWFSRRTPANTDGPKVILWPDTFNDHFHPETLQAAVEVLERAGYRLIVPTATLCCGRPLYDFGMLDLAAHLLRRILDDLRPEIRAGVPLVGLEPSCVSVFRDEMTNLLADDEDARRLFDQTYLFSEFMVQRAGDFPLPRLERRAIVHGHCHHKSVLGMGDEETLLDRLGLDYRVLDSGCCGMAGAFGFERDHYDVSIQVGERVLLPAVRAAPRDAVVITDGFSCREQIRQTTDRRALHVAQVVQMAMRQGPGGPPGEYPERGYDRMVDVIHDGHAGARRASVGVAALAGGALAVAWQRRRSD
ncbi:MAG TPA: FAD-binding and (Fe-S)-binding domain-containing protein [Thermomicrobiaceae bacterium]|nr:FAD-binding and (Fe-S)-binding domain-containing protein [Thermomicrobiaceae bacterium]